jgi:TetR/AcrR family transcriptional regulator
MKNLRNVEQDIIEGARKVFQEKGYKGATMRDIASEANINMAMLHYYFRSKDNLFYLVFDDAFRVLYHKIHQIITDDRIDLFEKIRIIVSEYISFFEINPYLPQFIMGEVIRNPEKVGQRIRSTINPEETFKVFSDQLREQYEKGIIREISVYSLILKIISLCVFPALARSVISEIIDVETVEMVKYIEISKSEVSDFIINSIKI